MGQDDEEKLAAILCNMDEGLEPGDLWGVRLIQSGKVAPHFGDCIKEPCTCMQCLYLNETVRAKKWLLALKEMGYGRTK